jgi:hypothetical protein
MQKKINPVVGVLAAIAVFLVVGLLAWKLFDPAQHRIEANVKPDNPDTLKFRAGGMPGTASASAKPPVNSSD